MINNFGTLWIYKLIIIKYLYSSVCINRRIKLNVLKCVGFPDDVYFVSKGLKSPGREVYSISDWSWVELMSFSYIL